MRENHHIAVIDKELNVVNLFLKKNLISSMDSPMAKTLSRTDVGDF